VIFGGTGRSWAHFMMYSRRSHGKRDAEEEMPGAYVGPGALGDGWRPALDEFGERNGSRWAMFRLTLGVSPSTL